MTADAVLSALRAAGCILAPTPDGRIDVEIPDSPPPEVDYLLGELRAVKPEALAILQCFQARKVIPLEELTRRREERRKRTEARLRSTPCDSCGRIDWQINGRGDAFCRSCFPARRTA